jgi:uncharacterized membrane protein
MAGGTPMSASDKPVRRGAPGWMKLVLILSLTVNLLIAGVVIGRWLAGDERPRGVDRTIGWMVRVIPEERREMAEAYFDAARPQLEAARAERMDQFGAVLQAIRTEPFDPAALGSAMTATLETRSSQRAIVYDRFATLLAQLTPEERAGIADRMEAWVNKRAAERQN